MYDLPYHKEHDERVVRAFVREHPFALLTGCDEQGQPVATQVPLFMEERDGRTLLRGHLMKGTDHHRAFAANPQVLAVFTGPQIYVSGSWYSNPHLPSTWNYMSVHARGTMRYLDEGELVQVLRETSLYFEGQDVRSPTTYDNLPEELTRRLVGMIVAFEVEVAEIDTVFKLSQDRDEESYRTIIGKLRSRGENGRAIAEAMEARAGELFGNGRDEA